MIPIMNSNVIDDPRKEYVMFRKMVKRMYKRVYSIQCVKGGGFVLSLLVQVRICGWPLSADAWEDQMIFLAERGYRCIAHDRRGHGRSSQPWQGNDMDTYADDLAALVTALDLKGMIRGPFHGRRRGGALIGRHGSNRASMAVLIGAVPPIMLEHSEPGRPADWKCSIRSAPACSTIDRSSSRISADRSMVRTGPATRSRRSARLLLAAGNVLRA